MLIALKLMLSRINIISSFAKPSYSRKPVVLEYNKGNHRQLAPRILIIPLITETPQTWSIRRIMAELESLRSLPSFRPPARLAWWWLEEEEEEEAEEAERTADPPWWFLYCLAISETTASASSTKSCIRTKGSRPAEVKV